ncbi:hypothetical protein SAMN04487957_10569 [Halomonas shengliensis]|uniref:Uncharacterized protein n=1 Tax=Halomonas shengliensis TaxID=419597 RepID=A0A1H0IDM9_9GAMM|nr:hypothetical protein [Halomonas shengliensis]SDO29181.1 hypothetical protein SAMN04487957_10569 [Halomonas shengliensis]
MYPWMGFLIGVAVGVVCTLGFQVLVVWCVARDLDDAGWMMEGRDDR